MSEMKEGDVFRWRYKPGTALSSNYTSAYWCKSCIAIFKDGFLGDTYWGESDRRAIREDDVDLTFLGNLGDYEDMKPKGRHFYDPDDILDLSHANDTRRKLLLKKGAKMSPATLIKHCQYKIERAESEMRSAEREIERMRQAIADIEAGKIEEIWV